MVEPVGPVELAELVLQVEQGAPEQLVAQFLAENCWNLIDLIQMASKY